MGGLGLIPGRNRDLSFRRQPPVQGAREGKAASSLFLAVLRPRSINE